MRETAEESVSEFHKSQSKKAENIRKIRIEKEEEKRQMLRLGTKTSKTTQAQKLDITNHSTHTSEIGRAHV